MRRAQQALQPVGVQVSPWTLAVLQALPWVQVLAGLQVSRLAARLAGQSVEVWGLLPAEFRVGEQLGRPAWQLVEESASRADRPPALARWAGLPAEVLGVWPVSWWHQEQAFALGRSQWVRRVLLPCPQVSVRGWRAEQRAWLAVLVRQSVLRAEPWAQQAEHRQSPA